MLGLKVGQSANLLSCDSENIISTALVFLFSPISGKPPTTDCKWISFRRSVARRSTAGRTFWEAKYPKRDVRPTASSVFSSRFAQAQFWFPHSASDPAHSLGAGEANLKGLEISVSPRSVSGMWLSEAQPRKLCILKSEFFLCIPYPELKPPIHFT